MVRAGVRAGLSIKAQSADMMNDGRYTELNGQNHGRKSYCKPQYILSRISASATVVISTTSVNSYYYSNLSTQYPTTEIVGYMIRSWQPSLALMLFVQPPISASTGRPSEFALSLSCLRFDRHRSSAS